MATLELKVELRDGKGKSQARQMRREGWVPGVYYGQDTTPRHLRVWAHDLELLFREIPGEHAVVNLKFAGESKKHAVLIREVQHHPTKGDVLHVDFNQISASRKVRIRVPVRLEGEPIGVKDFGGVLEHGIREVEVECLPRDLPEHIAVDVSELKIGDAIHVSDLPAPDRVAIHTESTSAVAIVVPPAVLKEAAPPEEEKEKEEEAVAEGTPEAEKKPESSAGGRTD